MTQVFQIAAVFTLAASTAFADPAGYTAFSFEAPHHGRGVTGAIWYPAEGQGRSFVYAKNPVFAGVTVQEEVPMQPGSHPVVLLSHGMGGNVRSLAWLGAAMAQEGAIVVAVNHPNTTWGDFDLSKGMHHWTRVQDLGLALDTLAADPFFADSIDEDRIMSAGFSYGGWTALSMAGLRSNHAGFVDHCETYGAESSHCDVMLSPDVNIQGAPEEAWNASYADARVTHAFSIDPGLVWGMTNDDARNVIDEVSIVGLGDSVTRLVATDFDSSGLADMLPQAKITRIAPANHFTAMPVCTPMGAAILEDEQDDPVCTDPEGVDRQEVHNLIVQRMATDLDL